MKNKLDRHLKLGIFVIAGAVFLFLLLFMIGKNKNMFGNTYVLKANFRNVQGLVAGNNVRYAGIQAGTVKAVSIINDTTIEVTMSISTKMKDIIRKNAAVSIGTEGLVGNKVVNIIPGKGIAELAKENELLYTDKVIDTDKILRTLQGTNEDVATIAAELKQTVTRINDSKGLWTLLNDETLPKELRMAAVNIHSATGKARNMTGDLETIVSSIKDGKGSVGALLTDSSFAVNLNEAVCQVRQTAQQVEMLSGQLKTIAAGLQHDMENGQGPLPALLRDSVLVNKLATSLDNIQKGTDGFNQNMEALKHNFLFRGYFRKQEKKARQMKETIGNTVAN